MDEDGKQKVKISVTIRQKYIDKLKKVRANYLTSKGKSFSFSGVLNLILAFGFKRFEAKHKIKIDDLEVGEEIAEE